MKNINITDPANFTWLPCAQRVYLENRRYTSPGALRLPRANPRYQLDGVGFVLGDGFAGIDLDHCVTVDVRPDGSKKVVVADWALAILDRFPETYAEMSPSRTGFKIFLKGKLSAGREGAKFTGFGERGEGAVEIYDRDRYFTVTGLSDPARKGKFADLGDELNRLYAELAGERDLRRADPAEIPNCPTPQPVSTAPAQRGPGKRLGDNALLDIARRARNGDRFRALFDFGDLSAYDGDASKADLALCHMLAFYTEKNEARIDGLFRRSALYRDKWERIDYRQMTMRRAVTTTTDVYRGKRVGKTR